MDHVCNVAALRSARLIEFVQSDVQIVLMIVMSCVLLRCIYSLDSCLVLSATGPPRVRGLSAARALTSTCRLESTMNPAIRFVSFAKGRACTRHVRRAFLRARGTKIADPSNRMVSAVVLMCEKSSSLDHVIHVRLCPNYSTH